MHFFATVFFRYWPVNVHSPFFRCEYFVFFSQDRNNVHCYRPIVQFSVGNTWKMPEHLPTGLYYTPHIPNTANAFKWICSCKRRVNARGYCESCRLHSIKAMLCAIHCNNAISPWKIYNSTYIAFHAFKTTSPNRNMCFHSIKCNNKHVTFVQLIEKSTFVRCQFGFNGKI